MLRAESYAARWDRAVAEIRADLALRRNIKEAVESSMSLSGFTVDPTASEASP